MDRSNDDICIDLLNRVNNPEFISEARRDSYWLREQKEILEKIAISHIEDREVENLPPRRKRKKKEVPQETPESKEFESLFGAENQEMPENFFQDQEEDNLPGRSFPFKNDEEGDSGEGELGKPGEDESHEMTQAGDSFEDYQENQRKKKDAVRDMEDAMREFSSMPDDESDDDMQSFGLGHGDEKTREIEARLLSRIPPSLKRLARMIGRTGGEEWMEGKGFSKASKSDITGITIGNDLNSLLPSEIAMLSTKGTQNVFYKNYAEKRLQVFASASSGVGKKDHQDGPVIICLDTSSSMNGEPETVAKALALAVSVYAMRRKRKVLIIKYSETHRYDTFMKMSKCRKRLMNFLRWTGSGGNDENSMFKDLFENILPQEGEYETADILCISDFGWTRLKKGVLEMIDKAKAGGMKFYGLAISSYMYQSAVGSMEICDSKWKWESGDCVNMEK